MATPPKPRSLARVLLTAKGHATVEFPEHALTGHIRRRGIQHYAVYNEQGHEVGMAARYESAARLLATHAGLRSTHTISVELVHIYPIRVRRPWTRQCPIG
jgi:hypothetical protein